MQMPFICMRAKDRSQEDLWLRFRVACLRKKCAETGRCDLPSFAEFNCPQISVLNPVAHHGFVDVQPIGHLFHSLILVLGIRNAALLLLPPYYVVRARFG